MEKWNTLSLDEKNALSRLISSNILNNLNFTTDTIVDDIAGSEQWDENKKTKNYELCSPTSKYTQSSCISYANLKELAQIYNKVNPDKKIKISNSKADLVRDLGKAFSTDSQRKWLNRPQFKQLVQKTDVEDEIKPYGSKYKNNWLSNFDIDKVMEQYAQKYDYFVYLLTAPIDFAEPKVKVMYDNIADTDFYQLYQQGYRCVANVFNLDKHNQGGSHWVSIFVDMRDPEDVKRYHPENYKKYFTDARHNYNNLSVEYFDSVGADADYKGLPPPEIENFLKKIQNDYLTRIATKKQQQYGGTAPKLDFRYNTVKHQQKNTECGVYSLNFIIERLQGIPYSVATGKRKSDEYIREFRRQYFIVG